MLFLGHFSFDEIGEADKVRHGYFTCLVEADTPDNAAIKFKSFIKDMKEKEELFQDIAAVYIEDLISVEKPGDKPVLLRMQSSSGEFPESRSHSFPLGKSHGMEAYGWAPNVRKHEKEADEGYQEAEPFINFQ